VAAFRTPACRNKAASEALNKAKEPSHPLFSRNIETMSRIEGLPENNTGYGTKEYW
jgi:hypothetical protein